MSTSGSPTTNGRKDRVRCPGTRRGKGLSSLKLGSGSPPASVGGRLQANELAAAVQDEVARGENNLMIPYAADP